MFFPDVSIKGDLSCHDVCFFLMFLSRVISPVMMSVFSRFFYRGWSLLSWCLFFSWCFYQGWSLLSWCLFFPDVSIKGGLSCHDVCFSLMFLSRVISPVMMSVFPWCFYQGWSLLSWCLFFPDVSIEGGLYCHDVCFFPDVFIKGGLYCHDVCFFPDVFIKGDLSCHDVCFFLMFLSSVVSTVMMSVFSWCFYRGWSL